MRKVNYKEKGITLIALVITIIILLILAGITLTTALGQNGLFQRAKYAGEKYKESEADEEEKLRELEKDIGKIADGENITEPPIEENTIEPPVEGNTVEPPIIETIPSEMKVGDIINYTPDTVEEGYKLTSEMSGYTSDQTLPKETFTWKVLSKNIDSVDIMGKPTSSMSKIYFDGETGYNNGVYYLNEMCKTLYSNNKLGVTARSINLQDIESKLNAKGIAAKGKFDGYIGEFSGKYAYYPNLAKYENILGIDGLSVNEDGIGESDDGTKLEDQGIKIPLLDDDTTNYTKSKSKADNKITVKQNYYGFDKLEDYFDDINFYSLIFGGNSYYFLASRCTGLGSEMAFFGLRTIGWEELSSVITCCSEGKQYGGEGNYGVVPVVTLGSDIQYEKVGSGVWNIKE